MLAAVWACQARHVLDAAEHADAEHVEKLDDPLRIKMCGVLRTDNDQRASEIDDPRELLLKVRCPGWKVDDQIIELAPIRAV